MTHYIISQFIPILLLLLLLMKTTEFVNFSQTMMGKLFAVCIIIFYTILDKTVGILSCVLIILFYQSDFVENTLNKFNVAESFNNIMSIIPPMQKTNVIEDKPLNILSYFPLSLLDTLGFTEYNSIPIPPDAITEFRKRNCNGNQLKYKGMFVKNENVDLIFPELSFKNDNCNPCDKSCNFSIIESKLKNETGLKPLQSNEVFDEQ